MTNTPPTIVIVGAGFAWRSFGGPKGDRTLDLQIANLALSQLSYGPGYQNYDKKQFRLGYRLFHPLKKPFSPCQNAYCLT